MKPGISRWKHWLSYIKDVHLESLESDFNEELHVLLARGRYQLCTPNAIYSFDDLYLNFSRAFQRLNMTQAAPRRVLLLGLGLGSIPLMLEQKFGLRAEYTAVEIDETIIYLASKYSLNGLVSPVEYVCAPADAFVAQCQGQYDLICMDIFQDDEIPPEVQTAEYLQQLQNLIAPKGMLLYNRLSATSKDLNETQTFFQEVFLGVFPQGQHLDVEGNWILVGKG